MPYHMAADADAAPRRRAAGACSLYAAPRRAGAPVRTERLEARGEAGARRELLAARRSSSPPEARCPAGIRAGRDPAAPRARPSGPRGRSPPAARRSRGTRRPAGCSCRSHGSSRAPRHTRTDPSRGRAPGWRPSGPRRRSRRCRSRHGIGSLSGARRHRRRRRPDPRGMAFRARGHRLRPRPHGPHRPAGAPAAIAMSAWTARSSLPPNPPPQAVGMIRTCSGGMPEDQRDLVAIHVRRLGADADSIRSPTGGPSPPRARCTRARRTSSRPRPRRDRRAGEGGVDVPAREPAADQDVAGRASWSAGAPGARAPPAAQGGSGVQAIGSSRRRSRRASVVADEREHRLTAMADEALGERRLVLAGRVDAVAVLAGDVGGGEHVDEARVAARKRRRGHRSRTRARVGRTNRRAPRASRSGRSSAPKRAVPRTLATPSTFAIRAPTRGPPAVGRPRPSRRCGTAGVPGAAIASMIFT